MDELFEAVTLIQTGKVEHFPIIMVGTAFFGGLMDWVRTRLVGDGMIDAADLDLVVVTDDPAEVVEIMKRASRQRAEDAPA
jgi:predicted Rossmann-fold nucleotide-binding protein